MTERKKPLTAMGRKELLELIAEYDLARDVDRARITALEKDLRENTADLHRLRNIVKNAEVRLGFVLFDGDGQEGKS